MERYTGNRWELIDQACELAEERSRESSGPTEVPQDSFGNYDPSDELLRHLDDRQ